jgi:hypothetical protein
MTTFLTRLWRGYHLCRACGASRRVAFRTAWTYARAGLAIG